MATYIAFQDLDGNTIQVNPEEVASIVGLKSDVLPVGVAAGSRVTSEDGSYVNVQGTVAATVALLGGANAFAFVAFNAAGAVVASRGVAGVVHTGVGDYLVTFDDPISGGVAGTNNGAGVAAYATPNQVGANDLQVLTWVDTLVGGPVATDLDTFVLGLPLA